jgi:hypothetical protein
VLDTAAQNTPSAEIQTLTETVDLRSTGQTTFLCSGKTHLFFPPPGEREGRRRRREANARSYCNLCPVKEMCKLTGRLGREHGIWGGENDEERAAAGFGPPSPHRRVVAQAARRAREEASADFN